MLQNVSKTLEGTLATMVQMGTYVLYTLLSYAIPEVLVNWAWQVNKHVLQLQQTNRINSTCQTL